MTLKSNCNLIAESKCFTSFFVLLRANLRDLCCYFLKA
jgi:hypothetical protein